MTERRKTGDKAEEMAAKLLEARGFSIVDRNWFCRMGELDLVATQDGLVVFVEVRSVRSGFLGSPEVSVDLKKQKKVARAAEIWLSRFGADYPDIRFDVIAIRFRLGRRATIDHIADAFVPPWAI